jgi:nucleoid-associated protein YgaU
MTRETKAGLVVSCSFLCLVGVVLYCKLTGKNPGLPDSDTTAGSVTAPDEPTPIEENGAGENGPQILASTFDNSGPGLDGEKSTTPTGSGLNSSASDQQGYRIPGSTSGAQNPSQAVASNSVAKSSTPDSSSENKVASAPSNPTYSIPDSQNGDSDSSTNVKETKSASNSSKDKEPTAKEQKKDAPADPLAELQKAYQDSNTNSNSKENQASTKTASQADQSDKEDEKELHGLDNKDKTAMTKSSNNGSNSSAKQTNAAEIQKTPDINNGDRKANADLDPPPIPAGLHDPFHSLPAETPVIPADASKTANQSPRDASARKSAAASGKTPDGRGSASPSNGTKTSGQKTEAVSSSTIYAPSTPISTIPSDGSSAAQNKTGDVNLRGSKVANVSSQNSSLTPGVMPSPRLMGIAPAGDTAPEPNVRLGPPLAGPGSNPSTPVQSPDSATALPPANQIAQVAVPNGSQSPTPANPYPTAATGPIQPAGFPAAKVDSYDEETYVCKQGDRFEDISTKFYQTEKYAQALLLFNRNHPRAIAAVRQDPPTLAAGQAVYIPPLRVLEKQYATAIPDHVPLGSTASPIPTNSDVKNPATNTSGSTATSDGAAGSQKSNLLDNRNPTVNGGAGPDASAPTGSGYAMPQDVRNPVQPAPLPGTLPATKTPAPGQDKTYQVPKNGETFWEISRKTLGNPNRWSEIARLNPQIKPQFPVPGDTILKMPADARLESINQTPVGRIN